MLKNMTGIIAFIAIIFFGSTYASAELSPSDQEVFSFLEDAFHSQISLGEKHHSLEQIEQILDPYFTKEYQQSFLEEHLFEEEAGFITYGTDFPAYYIPFFSYNEDTKVVKEKEDEIIVYEFFSSDEDMPSLYDDHYEYVKLNATSSGWIVKDYGFEYEIPDFVKNNEEKQDSLVNTVSKTDVSLQRIYPLGMFASPFFHSLSVSIPLVASQLLYDYNQNRFLVTR